MKIAIFTDTYFPDMNGVARTLKRFTDYLETQHISYKIFAPDSNADEYASSHILRFRSLSLFLYPECRLAFPNLLRVKNELQNFSPDIIHVATPFNIGLCGVYFAKKFNIPLVGSYHTDFEHYLKYYDLQFLTKSLWKYMNWFHKPCRKLFVPSHETLNQLKNKGFENLEIWSRGVDCQLFHPFYDKKSVRKKYSLTKKYLLTYVGRLAPEKEVQCLPEILKSMSEKIRNQIDWLVVGDGPLREDLQKNAPSNIKFTGYLEGRSLAEVYSASDLFVFPSTTETFGNVVLEALASGTPVIGAYAGGVKNIIKPGVTGELCSPGNIDQFSQSIERILTNDSKRMQMRLEGRKFALMQKWDRIFACILWHYWSLIEEQNGQKHKRVQ